MKRMFTMHFRNTPDGRRDLWQMAASGWQHRAYIVKKLLIPASSSGSGDGGLFGIEVTVYDTTERGR